MLWGVGSQKKVLLKIFCISIDASSADWVPFNNIFIWADVDFQLPSRYPIATFCVAPFIMEKA